MARGVDVGGQGQHGVEALERGRCGLERDHVAEVLGGSSSTEATVVTAHSPPAGGQGQQREDHAAAPG